MSSEEDVLTRVRWCVPKTVGKYHAHTKRAVKASCRSVQSRFGLNMIVRCRYRRVLSILAHANAAAVNRVISKTRSEHIDITRLQYSIRVTRRIL